jgi:VanZ family protein
MLPVKHVRLWQVLSCLLIAAALAVCLMPGKDVPDLHVSDKYEHSTLYAALFVWFAGMYPRSRYWVVAVGLFLFGVGIEFAQAGMHMGRQGDVHDVIANTIGLVIGAVLAFAGLGGWAQWIDGWSRGREAAKHD